MNANALIAAKPMNVNKTRVLKTQIEAMSQAGGNKLLSAVTKSSAVGTTSNSSTPFNQAI